MSLDLRFQAFPRALGSSSAWLLAALAVLGCGGATKSGATPASSEASSPASRATKLTGRQVAVGGSHACAVTSEGTVRCWGANAHGELGDGTSTRRTMAVSVHGLSGVTEVALGDAHSCARTNDGAVWCWGENAHGELGDGTTTPRGTPAKVPDLREVVSIAAGGAQTCAQKGDGVVLCWGDRNGNATKTPIPVFGLSQATSIAVGPHHACAIVAPDGAVRCWGDNALRQLGVPRMADRGMPSEVRDLAGAKELRAGRDATCALTGDGKSMCWGGGLRCVPGAFLEGRVVAVKPAAVDGLDGLVGIAAGGDRACGIKADGSVACVKPHGAGGGAEHMCEVEPMPALRDAAKVVLGDDFGCLVARSDGTVQCWGANAAGQLGDGTMSARMVPVAVRAE